MLFAPAGGGHPTKKHPQRQSDFIPSGLSGRLQGRTAPAIGRGFYFSGAVMANSWSYA